MTFTKTIPVEFNHCDPAGIVFYPRYFEMTNSVIENFFSERLGRTFADITMRDHNGVPTVQIGATFCRPTRLGEKLDFALSVTHIGNSSVRFALQATGAGDLRMTADLTLVWVTPEGHASPWPHDLRIKLLDEMASKGRLE